MEQTYNPKASLEHLQVMRMKVQQAKKADGTYKKIEGLPELTANENPKNKNIKKIDSRELN